MLTVRGPMKYGKYTSPSGNQTWASAGWLSLKIAKYANHLATTAVFLVELILRTHFIPSYWIGQFFEGDRNMPNKKARVALAVVKKI